jgi:hypothetical protein
MILNGLKDGKLVIGMEQEELCVDSADAMDSVICLFAGAAVAFGAEAVPLPGTLSDRRAYSDSRVGRCQTGERCSATRALRD